MATRSAGLTEIEDGLPVWRVQVEDPQVAEKATSRAYARVLELPQGTVAAVALELYDVPGRPAYHHLCGTWQHPGLQAWFAALRAQGKVRLRFERADWVVDSHRDVELDGPALAALPTLSPPPGQDPDGAVRVYSSFYREQFPRLKNAEAVWDACLADAYRPVAVLASAWPKWALAIGIALALALGAWFAMKGGW